MATRSTPRNVEGLTLAVFGVLLALATVALTGLAVAGLVETITEQLATLGDALRNPGAY